MCCNETRLVNVAGSNLPSSSHQMNQNCEPRGASDVLSAVREPEPKAVPKRFDGDSARYCLE
jgi:hypothetical protein